MIIDYEFLKGFERTLDDALFKGMGLGEDQLRHRCSIYLKEDPDIVSRRESLHQGLERFEAVLTDLQNIPAPDPSPGDSHSGYNTEADEGRSAPLANFPEAVDEPGEVQVAERIISRPQSPPNHFAHVPVSREICDEISVLDEAPERPSEESFSRAWFGMPSSLSQSTTGRTAIKKKGKRY